MARLTKTYTGDFTTFVAKKIIELALKQAKKKGKSTQDVDDDDVVSGGGQSNPVNPVTSIVPVRKEGSSGLSRNVDPKTEKITNIINNLNDVINNPAAFPGEKENARDALKKYTKKLPRYERGFFPKNFNGGIEVKEKKLGVFLEKVAISLSSSINTINQKMDEANEGIIAAKDGIDQTYKKLEDNSDTLSDKLDAIIEALRYSNIVAKEKKDRKEAATKIAEQKQEVDLSNANRILMQDMDRQEIRDMQAADLAEDDRGPISDIGEGDPLDDDTLPQLAEGGIVSGPDSGYLAVLHGDEAVIPLDNNFTQGEPTAVGKEPISQMPMMAERGITPGDNPDNMKPTFKNNINVSTPMMKTDMGSGGEDLAKAIQLPAKIAGLVTGGLMTNVLSTAMLPPGIVNHIKNIANPVMEAFGVGSLADNLKEDSEKKLSMEQERQSVLAGGAGRRGREEGILQKIKKFIFGEGGGNMTYRGMGGNTYVNNRTSGTGGYGRYGGYGYGGRNIASLPPYQDGRTPTRLFYNSPYKSPEMFIKDQQTIQDAKERFKLFTGIDLAKEDSQFFNKNITYDNAFDYNKFSSPEYGLKTSNVAYNMSMQDEVDGITEALSEPNEQIIMNNQTSATTGDSQMELSPIAVRGNPLKQGIYVSPYSV